MQIRILLRDDRGNLIAIASAIMDYVSYKNRA